MRAQPGDPLDLTVAKALATVVLLSFAGLEAATGAFFQGRRATWKDTLLDAVSTAVLPLAVVPFILTVTPHLVEQVAPGSRGWLAHWPAWGMFGALLLADDLTQYWWHRLSHRTALFSLHRAHHSARYLSVRVVYRNNLVYYLLMPGLWLSAVLVHWGFGPVYAVYLLCKMSIIIAAHSPRAWDAPLYARAPRFMWAVERLLSTPATHSAHHGLHRDDGVTHYNGNFGNFLFLWDVVFGTAHITRRRPEHYGLEGLEPVGLIAELLVPVRPKRIGSTPQAD